jgi:hypothetical protein
MALRPRAMRVNAILSPFGYQVGAESSTRDDPSDGRGSGWRPLPSAFMTKIRPRRWAPRRIASMKTSRFPSGDQLGAMRCVESALAAQPERTDADASQSSIPNSLATARAESARRRVRPRCAPARVEGRCRPARALIGAGQRPARCSTARRGPAPRAVRGFESPRVRPRRDGCTEGRPRPTALPAQLTRRGPRRENVARLPIPPPTEEEIR